MPALNLPSSCDAITPAWLTAAMGPATLGEATIVGFETKRVGEGVGFMGVVNRLTLEYDRPAPEAPRTVIAKFPAGESATRELAATFRHYEKEIRFYEDMAAASPMRVPRSYFQAWDPEGGGFALLLEDVKLRNGDHLAGVTVDEARLAVKALAQLQARWWNSPDLHALGWLPASSDPTLAILESVFQQCWEPYCGFLGEALPAELRPVGARLSKVIEKMMGGLSAGPMTLIHGDYRADNFFFGDTAEAFMVIDWQIIMKGMGAFDLAYFVTGNLSVQDRRAAEGELVRLYHDTLVAGGVAGYSFDDCWRDYRTCAVFGWIWPVVAIGTLDPSNERGLAVFNEWSKRVCTAIVDLKAGEMLAAYEA